MNVQRVLAIMFFYTASLAMLADVDSLLATSTTNVTVVILYFILVLLLLAACSLQFLMGDNVTLIL